MGFIFLILLMFLLCDSGGSGGFFTGHSKKPCEVCGNKDHLAFIWEDKTNKIKEACFNCRMDNIK